MTPARPPGLPDRAVGIDLGGTKIEGVILDGGGAVLARQRIPAPRDDYRQTIAAVTGLVSALAAAASARDDTVGIGIPGSVSPRSGLIQNANSTWLNGRPFHIDLSAALDRPVRIANDANCFALSEATDGAGAGAPSVFGVILGTGCGGGLVSTGAIIDGPRGTGGEWGHNPLPWPAAAEIPGPRCWCGRHGCIETWVSGPGLAADHARATGDTLSAEEIASRAAVDDPAAVATLERHLGRLARGLAHVINVFDPHVVVLGGGLSKLQHLYARLPTAIAPWVFADSPAVDIRPPRWGDASGVRGAAWLWREPRAA
jgi:fructokinase